MLLSHMRVLDFTVAWAGPLAGRWFGDLGADVIHVERVTGRGAGVARGAQPSDEVKNWTWGTLPGPTFRSGVYPDADPGERPWNRQGLFNKMNRNKRSLTVDLKTAEGIDILHRLARVSDVVLDNFSPRVMDSLDLGYAALSALNPGIICAALSGFGHTGPHRDWVSYGPILEAHSGLAATTGYADGSPMKLGVALPDGIGGLTGTFAILSALWDREQTGVGAFIDLSQLEAYVAIAGEQVIATSISGASPAPHGNRSTTCAPQGVYPCRGDDEWISLTVRSDEEWEHLVAIAGCERLRDSAFRTVLGRIEGHACIDEALATWTRALTKQQAADILRRAGIAAAAVMTNADLVNDPHLAERGFMVDIDQADVGVRSFPGFPLHFSATPVTAYRGAPPLGGDNEAILKELLGYPLDAVRRLEQQGVLGANPPPP